MRQIVLDTETTGLSAETGDRIIEIACVELIDRKLTGQHFHRHLNPERDSHEDALKVHGLTSEFLKDKPKFAAIVDDLIDYLRGAELIIHNAPFDVGFLNKELELAGRPVLQSFAGHVIDSLVLAKQMFPGKRNSLDALCDRLEVDNSSRTLHGALLDAQLLADVYIRLTRGQNSLAMDLDDTPADQSWAQGTDLSQLELTVVQASESELAAHESVLLDLDKASKGKTLWRTA
ncbi:MAG: DNA polymerase III subunit epsilon [Betaproteobacteria bacterium]|nr:DNA polymerase III subunit epsilon [Betaproteobacteria bacterium]